jgi:hypothetical protein
MLNYGGNGTGSKLEEYMELESRERGILLGLWKITQKNKEILA